MKRILLSALLMFQACLLFTQPAWAGTNCKPRKITPVIMKREINAALKLESALERGWRQEGHRLAIIARQGADLSRHGLKFSHAAFALRQDSGQWRVIQLLNSCGSDYARLYRDGLLNFVQDDLYTYDFAIAFPARELSRELTKSLESGWAKRLFRSNYNLIANPTRISKYQNCNMWLLELVAASNVKIARRGLISRRDILREYTTTGFYPDYVRAGMFERIGAKLGQPNIHFDDHSFTSRMSGKYPVVSVRALLCWMEGNDQLTPQEIIRG